MGAKSPHGRQEDHNIPQLSNIKGEMRIFTRWRQILFFTISLDPLLSNKALQMHTTTASNDNGCDRTTVRPMKLPYTTTNAKKRKDDKIHTLVWKYIKYFIATPPHYPQNLQNSLRRYRWHMGGDYGWT